MVTSEWPSPELPHGGCFIEQQVRFLREAGVDVEVLPFKGRHRPLNYFRIWRRIRRTIRAGSYDLVHAQFGHSGALCVTPKSLPVVVTFRGSDLQSSRVWRTVSRYAARRADATIVVAERMRSLLPRPPIAVIPSGIDLELFRPVTRDDARRELELPLAERLVLFIGSPTRVGKRLGLAREAVDLVPDARLLPVWDVPRETVALLMSAADVLLLVSKWEGSPNVVKEALACDLPVVSVDVGDVRERIGDVDGCIVCQDDTPATIARALQEVLTAGRRVEGRRAVRDLDETLLTAKVVGIYESIAGGVRI